MSEDALAERARAEVARVVSGRMKQLGVSAAELRRRSGLSVNTIRGITEGASKPHKSTWIAISAVLDWPWDYLVNILNGRSDKNAASPLERHLSAMADRLGAMDGLREDVAWLKEVIHEIDRKIDLVIEYQHGSEPRQTLSADQSPRVARFRWLIYAERTVVPAARTRNPLSRSTAQSAAQVSRVDAHLEGAVDDERPGCIRGRWRPSDVQRAVV